MGTDYDVIVVGCGPAGSTAAEHAARGGASVLVLERRKNIGEPVACGEFMPLLEEMETILPQAPDLASLFEVPEHLISRRMDLFRLFSPARHWDVPFKGYTTDRDRFDRHLADKARKAGAEIVTSAPVTAVDGATVRTADAAYRAKVVVGADGPASTAAQGLGLPRNRDPYPAITVPAEGDLGPIMEMHFGSVAPGAYAWVLPKGKGANVGVGVGPRWADEKLTEYLDRFLVQRGLSTVGRPVGKHVPSQGPLARTVAEHGLLVGDAAGHVIAVNGGGTPIAMICGRLAGRVAAEHAAAGAPLAKYEEMWRAQVGKPLRTAVRTKMLADLFLGSGRRLELSMRLVGARRMGKMLRCRPLFP